MRDLRGLFLITVVLAAARLKASANPLLDFELQGDETMLPAADDGSSEAVTLTDPFVFYGSSYTSLYVSRMLPITFMRGYCPAQPCCS